MVNSLCHKLKTPISHKGGRVRLERKRKCNSRVKIGDQINKRLGDQGENKGMRKL